MNWRPNIRLGVLVGSGILLLIAAIDAGLLWRVIRGPINGLTFVCAFVVLDDPGAVGCDRLSHL